MDLLHGLWVRDDKVVVAAVVFLAAELPSGQVERLQAGAHGAVVDEDLLFKGVQKAALVYLRFI